MRKERSDKGIIRFNDRDTYTLTWIGEQYAVRLDTLQSLLGRQAYQPTRKSGVLGHSTVRRVVRRWRRESLVEVRKFHYGHPHWIWLTRQGLTQMDLDFKRWSPKLGMLAHHHQVNEVRLRMERQFGQSLSWHSERELRQQHRRSARLHIPDGEVSLPHGLFAVEIELTCKSRRRMETIVRKLIRQQYAGIWFFVNASTRRQVEAAIQIRPELFALYDIAELSI